jgi:hypothetical protein
MLRLGVRGQPQWTACWEDCRANQSHADAILRQKKKALRDQSYMEIRFG